MKQRKGLLIFLSALLLLSSVLPAAAKAQTTARLYNVYGDHMLFQQNEAAVFAGEAAPGATLTVTLKNAAGQTVQTAAGTADADGTFALSFPAPAGSYDEYTVTVLADGKVIAALSDVVFGELWLAFGQSNMEYTLKDMPEGAAMAAANETGSAGLRVLQVPHPVKNGQFAADGLPQTDAQNCHWFTADNADVYDMSAVAYFFASQLQRTLDVPVGILNVAVGGSALAAWLSRDAILSDSDVRLQLSQRGEYITQQDWDTREPQFQIDMTGLYNSKIAPLTNFHIAGGVWYQGETDLMMGHTNAFYEQMFTLLQKSYTTAFDHKNGALPLIFTQLAAFTYNSGPYRVSEFNEAFTTLAKNSPADRGMVTIYDLPLSYNYMGEIHPMTKKPIGERMASIAEGLVYGSENPASAPVLTKSKAAGDSVTLTFNNVGDGLLAKNGPLQGFAVCGEDGVCLPARAEIVSADTVRVWNEDVAAPVAATYAVNGVSLSANLFSSVDGAPYLPAAPFGMSDPAVKKLCSGDAWLSCDTLTAWLNHRDSAGEKTVWTAANADLSLTDNAAEGASALELRAQKKKFSVSPLLSALHDRKPLVFDSMDTDYRAYGTLTLRLKNNGTSPVTLESIRLYTGKTKFYTPRSTETETSAVVLPADGAWHAYSFDLNQLQPYGGSALPVRNNDVLTAVTAIRFNFSGNNADISMDDVHFTAETETGDPVPTGFSGFFSYLREQLAAFFESFRAIFGGSRVC